MNLSKVIVFGYFSVQYLIVPLGFVFSEIYLILIKKQLIRSLGTNVMIFDSKYKFSKISFAINLLLIFSSVLFLIYDSIVIGILISFPALVIFTTDQKQRIFSKLNGFYENGIIYNDIQIKWKDLFSYKIFNEQNVSLLLKTGTRFDVFLERNKTDILKLLDRNHIKIE